MLQLSTLLLLIACLLLPLIGEQIPVDLAPRIISKNGNLHLQTHSNKHIYLKTNDHGTIFLNDIDLNDFSSDMQTIKTKWDQVTNRKPPCNCELINTNFKSNMRKIRRLKKQLKETNTKLSSLIDMVYDLKAKSQVDNCADNPCHNGGTCIDGYDSYKCLCPKSYTGDNCQEDVNECDSLRGTDLGCQNGARCINLPGSFRCECPAGGHWFGVLCDRPNNGCSGSSSADLCGHGICVPYHNPQSTGRNFKCICDAGWSLDTHSGTCIQDVNECSAVGRYPCSTNPLVACINTPGGFSCAQCPTGYTGTGFICQDIDECATRNRCGVNEVCQNTAGSYTCQCYEGMIRNRQGNCQRSNACEINNGGCNIYAMCQPNNNVIEGRICSCNPGYEGSGIGVSGCVRTSSISPNNTNANYRLCVVLKMCGNNGVCQPTSTNYVCRCHFGYSGQRCSVQLRDPCLSNPCQNGGHCRAISSNNYQCQCGSYFSGVNCEFEHSECGRNIILPENDFEIKLIHNPTISSSNPRYRYPCRWMIMVSSEKFIQVVPTFLNFHGSCDAENVKLIERTRNGQNRTMTYCQDSFNKGFNTTTSVLTVIATLSNSYTGSHGFILNIKPTPIFEQDINCCKCQNNSVKGTIASHGIFQSPHYPLSYPTNYTCFLMIRRNFGVPNKIELNMQTMDLGDRINQCQSRTDLIWVFTKSVGEFKINACNQSLFQNKKITDTRFFIIFKTDSHPDSQFSRFKITWKPSIVTDPCGGIIGELERGTIEAPGFGNSQNAVCSWKLENNNQTRLIHFKSELNNWQEGPCVVYIKIFAEATRKICQSSNNMMLDDIYSTKHDIIIELVKPAGFSTPPLRIRYEYRCGGIIDMDELSEYVMKTDNYPLFYKANLNCMWKFVSKTRKILIEFIDFDIADTNCDNDYVKISGNSIRSMNKRFCNGNKNELFPLNNYDTNTPLQLDFVSNSSISARGFHVKVSVIECGGSYLIGRPLSITYPDTNGTIGTIEYGPKKKCIWNFMVLKDYSILVVFNHFHLERHSRCRFDYLQFNFDGNSTKRFCGLNAEMFSTRSNRLQMKFVSDYTVGGEGFELRLYAIHHKDYCGEEYEAASGHFQAPSLSPGRSKICIYTVKVPAGLQIGFNIFIPQAIHPSQMTLSNSTCRGSKLIIRDGNLKSPLIAILCPENPQRGLIQTSFNKANIVYFLYRTPFQFSVEFFSIDKGCGTIKTKNRGLITSPNYPLFPPVKVDCNWEIRSKPGQFIQIIVVEIRAGSVQSSSNCISYKKHILKIRSQNRVEEIKCQNQTNVLYSFFDHRVWITFNNIAEPRSRFTLRYRILCGLDRINHVFGRIESSYDVYEADKPCTWILKGFRGNNLQIQMDNFDFPNPVNGACESYLKISDSRTILLPKSCGQSLQNYSFVTSNLPVKIVYYLNPNTPLQVVTAHKGFSLEYKSEGCMYTIYYDPQSQDNQISRSKGTFQSPNYPDLITNKDCQWSFNTVLGYSVKIIITDLSIHEADTNCTTNPFISLFEYDTKVMNICTGLHEGQPYKFKSSTHQFKFNFLSAASNQNNGRKFKANYEFVNFSCEHELHMPSGIIKSPNYPKNYPNNLVCRWDIKVRPSSAVHLKFLDFHLEGGTCKYDFVQISSLMNNDYEPIGRYCGKGLPSNDTIASLSNEMRVTMKTDYGVNRRGFKAEYSESCGGVRLVRSEQLFIFSPNYPRHYQLKDGKCEWILKANISNPSERIFFHMLSTEHTAPNFQQPIRCDPSANISVDGSITLRNGMDEDAPIIKVFCLNSESETFVSSGSYLRLVLWSNTGNLAFKASFGAGSEACGGELYHSQGLMMNPFYPEGVNMELDCRWIIRGAAGSRIKLYAKHYDIGNGYAYFDYVEIRQGPSINSPLFGRYYKFNALTNETATRELNNTIMVRLRSQGGRSTNTIKFLMRYELDYPTSYNQLSGSLASPEYGHLYPIDTSKTWIIESDGSPDSNETTIEFKTFSIGTKNTYLTNAFCSRGYLKIEDGNGDTQYLCGSVLPPTMSLRKPITLTLNSNGYRYPGFLLQWKLKQNETHIQTGSCSYELLATEEVQYLQSPGFPNFDPKKRNCSWTIKAPQYRALDVQMLNFSMEKSTNCKYERFEIKYKIMYTLSTHFVHYYTSKKSFCGSPNLTTILKNFTTQTFKEISINFIVDLFDPFPGFRLQYKLRCFRYIVFSPEGWLQSNGFPQPITSAQNCLYKFKMSYYSKYQINITNLDLPSKVNSACQGSYLMIGNKKYCGNQINEDLRNITIRSNTKIYFITTPSDSNSQYTGFKLRYSLIQNQECGGTFTLNSNSSEPLTIIESFSKQFIQCTWSITATYGQRMRIDFDKMYFSTSTCDVSYLVLYDGSTNLSPKLLGRNICSHRESIFTTGDKLLIVYRTENRKNQFKLRVTIAECGGTTYLQSGSIASPGYPIKVKKKLNCTWNINSQNDKQFQFSLKLFFNTRNCDKFNLTIVSYMFYPSNQKKLEWTNCNSTRYSRSWSSIGNRIEVFLSVKSTDSRSKFKLDYIQNSLKCQSKHTQSEGEIKTINYPGTRPYFFFCEFTINVDVTRSITLNIVKFDYSRTCIYIHHFNIKLMTICESKQNFIINTNVSSLSILLPSSRSHDRLFMRYKSDRPSSCGRHIRALKSNNNTLSYQNVRFCSQIFHNYPTDSGTLIMKLQNIDQLNCATTTFKLSAPLYEDNSKSIFDYLSACDSMNGPKTFMTPARTTTLSYYRHQSYSNISLDYKFHDCGGILSSTVGQIMSPNYPSKYPSNIDCEWLLIAPSTMHIKLTIVNLTLEHHTDCKFDHFSIRYGPNYDSPVFKSFCGQHPNENEIIIFRNNILRLSFHSDYSNQQNGFLVRYTYFGAVDNCNGIIYNTSGSIMTPNYPKPYPSYSSCNWTIVVPDGYRVKVKFDSLFDLEKYIGDTCPFDSLKIFDSRPDQLIVKLCGHIAPVDPIFSSQNRMALAFTSDFNNNLDGFRATYTTVCGGVFNETNGDFSNPSVYISNRYTMYCEYVIPKWTNHITILKIRTKISNCYSSVNYIEIWKSIHGRETLYRKICSDETNLKLIDVKSIKIKVNVTYRTNKDLFKISYLHEENEKVYYNFTGRKVIKTPHFPSPYHHNADLVWKFMAPESYIFFIKFIKVDIERSAQGCRYDYVAAYKNWTIHSDMSLFGKLCGQIAPMSLLKIDNNEMALHFVSDSSHYLNHTGFVAGVFSTPGPQLGCGGYIELGKTSRGSIKSPDIDRDGKYDHNLLCIWRLMAPAGYAIKLNFVNNSVSMEKRLSNSCIYDKLMIFDGQSTLGHNIETLCGNDAVDDLTSVSNDMVIKFVSDASISKSGFKIFYQVVLSNNFYYLEAGTEFVTQNSSNYPDNMALGSKVMLNIVGPNTTDNLLLELLELKMRPSSNCSIDSFEIRDTSEMRRNQIMQICKSIELPRTFISSGSTAVVVFKTGSSDAMSQGVSRRFKFRYKLFNCNRTETAYSGRIMNIESHNNQRYSNNMKCQINISAPMPNQFIQFYFHRFNIEVGVGCKFDYLQFTFGKSPAPTYKLDKLCGKSIPPTIVSNTSFVSIDFVTDWSVNKDGFDITYFVNKDVTKKCGGETEVHSGSITSPGYGTNYYEAGECEWKIKLTPEYALIFQLTDFQMSSSVTNNNETPQNCDNSQDYITIEYESRRYGNMRTIKLCQSDPSMPAIFTRKSIATVKYKSRSGGLGLGFRLEWTFELKQF